ncbi:SDR family oxidoreductase [Candidatus Planktophila versatilis]|nr:SDR family oxidoreductase [Candidatus Planktophila versatilis]
MKLLVLGSRGFLGSHLMRVASAGDSNKLSVTGISEKFRSEIDIQALNLDGFDVIVYCAALANLEDCEVDPEYAFWVNSEIPKLLCQKIQGTKSKFVYISTDAIFDGSKSFVEENDSPNPKSVYGKSKLQGEVNVSELDGRSLICRVNFFGSSPKNNSLFDYFYDNLIDRKKIIGFSNIFFTPISVNTLSRTILDLIMAEAQGIYHVCGSERISKLDFGIMIENLVLGTSGLVEPCLFTQTPTGPARSLDLSMSIKKLINLGISLPPLSSQLVETIQKRRITLT